MLPKKYRLQANEIELIKKRGFLMKSKSFSILVSDATEQPTRFAFIVSTKISKLATKRNKIKRTLSSSVERIYDKIKPNKCIIFLAKKELELANQDMVDEEVLQIFKYNKLSTN